MDLATHKASQYTLRCVELAKPYLAKLPEISSSRVSPRNGGTLGAANEQEVRQIDDA